MRAICWHVGQLQVVPEADGGEEPNLIDHTATLQQQRPSFRDQEDLGQAAAELGAQEEGFGQHRASSQATIALPASPKRKWALLN
jgi:hypothetical protein